LCRYQLQQNSLGNFVEKIKETCARAFAVNIVIWLGKR
jgi:hypothetical protein